MNPDTYYRLPHVLRWRILTMMFSFLRQRTFSHLYKVINENVKRVGKSRLSISSGFLKIKELSIRAQKYQMALVLDSIVDNLCCMIVAKAVLTFCTDILCRLFVRNTTFLHKYFNGQKNDYKTIRLYRFWYSIIVK